ncbi:MAG: endolytic transglycosylase MltG [Gemmatimonadota bacterium]
MSGAGQRSDHDRHARRIRAVCAAALLASLLAACGTPKGEPERIRVPAGASFGSVADSLAAHGIVRSRWWFGLYARVTGATENIKAGTYAFVPGTPWRTVLGDLTAGRILTEKLVIPEGWGSRQIAPRLAELAGLDPDSVLHVLRDTTSATRWHVPGPTLEGYLYPATYTVPADAPLDTLIGRLVHEYRSAWTPARQARADSIGMSQRQVVTLASIVQKEARHRDELPLIAAVYRNRLRLGYLLQADPTVQYALGEHHDRLLYADIQRVAKSPYNTYRHRGLPPGPIASPDTEAIDAVLHPADVRYLYFVAAPDGSHVFSRTLVEHNRAVARMRRMRRQIQSAGNDSTPARSH